MLFAVLTKEMLASQWNPHVLVFPTMAIVVVAAAVAAGRIRWLPVLAASRQLRRPDASRAWSGGRRPQRSGDGRGRAARLPVPLERCDAAIVADPERHALAPAPPLAAAARAGAFRARWQPVAAVDVLRRRSEARSTVADLVQDLVRHDFSGPAFGRSRRMGESLWAQPGPDEPVLGDYRNGGGGADRASRRRSRKIHSVARWPRWSSSLQAVGLWSITRIEDDVYDHLVFWLAGIGALHLGLIADALVRLVPRAAAAAGTRQIAAACLLLFGIGAAAGFQDLRVIVSRSFRPRIEQLSVPAAR